MCLSANCDRDGSWDVFGDFSGVVNDSISRHDEISQQLKPATWAYGGIRPSHFHYLQRHVAANRSQPSKSHHYTTLSSHTIFQMSPGASTYLSSLQLHSLSSIARDIMRLARNTNYGGGEGMSKKKRASKTGPVWHQSSDEATLAKKPLYNGFACGHGAHGNAKYCRAKEKRTWEKQLKREGASHEAPFYFPPRERSLFAQWSIRPGSYGSESEYARLAKIISFDVLLHAMPHYFDAFVCFEYRANRSSNKLRYNGENSAFPLKGASWTLNRHESDSSASETWQAPWPRGLSSALG